MAVKDTTFNVAISSDFLTAFAGIPKQKQGKVIQFISKFRSNPMSSGINYEKVKGAYDPGIRSVRIDNEYRGIVYKPEGENVFLLLWVDNHDDAYDWARRKRCIINSETGNLQIFEVDEEVAVDQKDTTEIEHTQKYDTYYTQEGIFDDFNNEDLMRIGVPKESLKHTRNIRNIDELDKKQYLFPREAYEALFFLASGYSLDEVCQELFGEVGEEEKDFDINNFSTALHRLGTKHQFMLIDDEEGERELNEMLAAPLEKWRVFLHPMQRRTVEKNYNGPARVLGGAGTGKTVVAMHRAKWLAQNVCVNNNDRILFTTFTRNLADDIINNLKKICPPELMKKIEVTNLDRWVVNFLKKQGYEYTVIYGEGIEEIWKSAFVLAPSDPSLSEAFYKEEWEKVIIPNEIDDLKSYLKVVRRGRGTKLDRKSRMAIWPVFEEFKNIMNEKGVRDIGTAMKEARILIENHNSILNYSGIIIDEAQDFGVQAFKLLRELAGEERPNDIFIVGDTHQRIYRNKASMSKCGINIIGRSSRLKINYRTTEEIRAWAYQLLHGLSFDDLDDGIDETKGYKSLMHGPKPQVKCFADANEEMDYIISHLEELEQQGSEQKNICLVTRTTKLLDSYKEFLTQQGNRVYQIKRNKAEDRNQPGLRIATMHRVKGLEFEHMIIAAANDGIIPLERMIEEAGDNSAKEDILISERTLLYVAATRAKQTVLITSYGKPSGYLNIE